MDLHQIQVTYQQDDDRVLVRATFNQQDGSPLEFRAWFTRRFIKILWPGISASFQAQVMLNQPQVAHVSAEIVNMENQAALIQIKAEGNFDAPFETTPHLFPLGEVPILVNNVEFNLNPNQPVRIHFTDAQKNGLELAFMPVDLHGFCTLLQQAVKAAEWDMELHMPGAPSNEGEPRVLN